MDPEKVNVKVFFGTFWVCGRLNSCCNVVPTQSHRHGVFGGLRRPKQSSKPPQIETWNTKNQWSFCQFL